MEIKKVLFGIFLLVVIASVCSFSVKAVTLLMVPQGGTGAGTFTAGDILQGNGTGAIQGSTMSGDATLAVGGALTIGANAIEESMLKAVNAPTDEYVLTYESTTGDFEWQASGSGDITSVGDVTSGAAFDGTQGTTLTFYNVGGNATLAYNGTTFTPSVFITGNVTGALTGNASTATALAANGGNCAAGSSPLGVDASGAVESCFDVWTEAENTAAGYTSNTGDVEDVFDCASGDCSTMTVGTSEWLVYGTGFIDANRFAGVTTVDSTEFGYLNGLTASIVQTGSASHDGFSDFVANEHLDWTADLGVTNIHAGNYTDTNTTYTAGRSLTLDGTQIDADSELYHHEKCFYLEDPVAADDLKSLFHFRKAATITGMWCESDQTVNMDLQLDDGTPADVNGTDLVCDTTPADDTTLGGDTGAGAGERLDLAITSVSGTPTWVSVCFDFTYDD